MNPSDLMKKYYDKNSTAHRILMTHSTLVAAKALKVAARLRCIDGHEPDTDFLYEAAMLHDVGIFMTHAPEIGCTGDRPYVCHGHLGRELLTRLGMPRHGLVCERHMGAGISAEAVKTANLPLPARDMLPVTLEEEIICYADKFYSKGGENPRREKSIGGARAHLEKFGADSVKRFDVWVKKFKRSK